MNDKVLEAIHKYRLISPGDSLAVGVSGGADSVALLHFLKSVAAEWRLSLTALHLNHRLRGAESNRDEAFVRRLCWDWHISLVVKSAPVSETARARGLSLEEAARELRYEFFAHSAAGEKVATAHTLSDNAETVLLNLTRGTALRGLCGIPPARRAAGGGHVIVRPLLLCTRGEVEEYCGRHGLDYVNDSSNRDVHFARNRLRRDVTPVLLELNPGWYDNLAGTVDALREDADFLDGLAENALERASAGADRYARDALLSLPDPVQSRAVLRLLRLRGIPVDRKRVAQVRELLEAGTGGAQLSGSWLARADERSLTLLPAAEEAVEIQPIVLREPYGDAELPVFPGKTLRIRVLDRSNFEETINNHANRFKNALDYDKIGKIVRIRQREPGDAIRIAGRGLTKSLKKLFNENAVPELQRQRMLVLAGGEGLLWAEGFGAAESAAVREDTRRVMTLDILEDEGNA